MTKVAAVSIYGKTPLKSISPEPADQWPSNLIYNIGDLSPTKFVQMMILGWPSPT